MSKITPNELLNSLREQKRQEKIDYLLNQMVIRALKGLPFGSEGDNESNFLFYLCLGALVAEQAIENGGASSLFISEAPHDLGQVADICLKQGIKSFGQVSGQNISKIIEHEPTKLVKLYARCELSYDGLALWYAREKGLRGPLKTECGCGARMMPICSKLDDVIDGMGCMICQTGYRFTGETWSNGQKPVSDYAPTKYEWDWLMQEDNTYKVRLTNLHPNSMDGFPILVIFNKKDGSETTCRKEDIMPKDFWPTQNRNGSSPFTAGNFVCTFTEPDIYNGMTDPNYQFTPLTAYQSRVCLLFLFPFPKDFYIYSTSNDYLFSVSLTDEQFPLLRFQTEIGDFIIEHDDSIRTEELETLFGLSPAATGRDVVAKWLAEDLPPDAAAAGRRYLAYAPPLPKTKSRPSLKLVPRP